MNSRRETLTISGDSPERVRGKEVNREGRGSSIMIVDDMQENLSMLVAILEERGYHARGWLDGESALQAATENPPDLVILDVCMPGMDGYEVCRRLKANKHLREIPVIFLSALQDTEAKLAAFKQGGVDYITRPFNLAEIHARIQAHLKLRRIQFKEEEYSHGLEALVSEQVREISGGQLATIHALARLSESRDDETGHHIERVSSYSKTLAEAMIRLRRKIVAADRRFVESIIQASPLHDIGKVGIPDAILLKVGKLSPEEYMVMKTHVRLGAETIDAAYKEYPKSDLVRMSLEIVRSHHERWDGAGYPDGLRGKDIPLSARIVAVADVYDALRSKRPYKGPWSHKKTRRTILAESGRQFDPDAVKAFESVEAEFDAINGRYQ